MSTAPRPRAGPRDGRYVGLLALVILLLITINTIVTKPNGAQGIEHGRALRRGVWCTRGLWMRVEIYRDGALWWRYKIATCPQGTFSYPAGVVESAALFRPARISTLRARARELGSAPRARGWRGGG